MTKLKTLKDILLDISATEEYCHSPELQILRMPVVGMTTQGALEKEPRTLTQEDIDSGNYFRDAMRDWDGNEFDDEFVSKKDLKQMAIEWVQKLNRHKGYEIEIDIGELLLKNIHGLNGNIGGSYEIDTAIKVVKYIFNLTEDDLSEANTESIKEKSK